MGTPSGLVSILDPSAEIGRCSPRNGFGTNGTAKGSLGTIITDGYRLW